MAMERFGRRDVLRGYDWLGHEGHGYSELNAIKTERGRRQVIVESVTSARAVVQFCETFAGDAFLLIGLNPRPTILTKPSGALRCARNTDIGVVRNVMFDLDFVDGASRNRHRDVHRFLDRADGYWRERGIMPPVRASTGNGYHLLFALPSISVDDHPRIAEQLRVFRNEYVKRNQQVLGAIGVRVDSTQDLRRMVRIYGTSKPGRDIASTFPDVKRNEDSALRDYLLSIPAQPRTSELLGEVTPDSKVPDWFEAVMANDVVIRNLWEGKNKRAGDTSASGYDYSLIRALNHRGHTKPDELATILLHRPNSPARTKGLAYVTRTVQRAREQRQP